MVFRLVGGGAEKVVMGLARFLDERKQLSRIYSSSDTDARKYPSLRICSLHAVRALGAARSLSGAVRDDPACAYLLTANYVALAPVLRLIKPRSRILARLAGIISSEMNGLSAFSKARYWIGSALTCLTADRVIVQGAEMKADLISTFPWVSPKVSLIHNFIEDEIWNHKTAKPPFEDPYIFCAATFRPVKAFDTLLAAYAHSAAREWRKLVIAGVDPDDPGLLDLLKINDLTSSEVIALGFVEKPYDLIANADLCTLVSRYEGFSNFLLEAAAFGKRIVATACPGGNRELLGFYENSLLVRVDDVEALASALAVERRDLSRQEARSALALFDATTVLGEYLRVLFA